MRKSYIGILALLSLSLSSAFAQQNISTVSPKIGDSSVVADLTLTANQTADPGTPGTGKSWDFSAFSPGSTLTTNKYVSPVGMPGATYFAGATLAATASSIINAGSGAITYLNTTSTGLQTIGLYTMYPGGAIIQSYSDPIFQDFPNLAYNGTFSDAMAGSQKFAPNDPIYDITGNINYKYDAHGTLKYAFGTFSNVGRVNYTTIQTFTGVEDYEDQSVKSESQNYAYYDITSKQLLMAIISSTTTRYIFTSPYNITTTKRVVLYKPFGITGLENEASLENTSLVYPNPTSDKFNVNEAFNSIKIKDSKGSDLIKKDLSLNNEVSVSELNNGVYFAELVTSRGEKKCVKLVISK